MSQAPEPILDAVDGQSGSTPLPSLRVRLVESLRRASSATHSGGRSAYWIGWTLAIGSTVAFSFAPPVARAAIVGGFDSNALLVARMVITTLLFGVTLAVTDRPHLRIPRRGLAAASLIGAINGLAMIAFFLSLNYLEASLTSMILALSPPLVLSLLALRGEKLTRRHLVRVGLALAGVFLLVDSTGGVNWYGAALAIISTTLFSLQVALTQWTLVGYPVRSAVFYLTACMTCFVVGWWWLQGAEWTPPGQAGWLAVAMLAIVSTFFARLGYYAAIRRIGSGQVALLSPLETLLAVLWAILFLGERLTLLQALGGALILASALLAIQRLGRVNLRFPRR